MAAKADVQANLQVTMTAQDVIALLRKADMHLMETLGALRLVAGSDILINNDRFNVLMPTPFVTNILAQTPATPAQLAAIKVATDQDAKAIAGGALFAIGTDVPLNAPGITNHTNLMALGLSMSNFLAMQAITINAAVMSFKDNDLGSVEIGKLADLTIVEGNPLDDLKYAANVKYVVKNGIVYTLPQIMAPFQSTAQLEARRNALMLFDKACAHDYNNCRQEPVDGD